MYKYIEGELSVPDDRALDDEDDGGGGFAHQNGNQLRRSNRSREITIIYNPAGPDVVVYANVGGDDDDDDDDGNVVDGDDDDESDYDDDDNDDEEEEDDSGDNNDDNDEKDDNDDDSTAARRQNNKSREARPPGKYKHTLSLSVCTDISIYFTIIAFVLQLISSCAIHIYIIIIIIVIIYTIVYGHHASTSQRGSEQEKGGSV